MLWFVSVYYCVVAKHNETKGASYWGTGKLILIPEASSGDQSKLKKKINEVGECPQAANPKDKPAVLRVLSYFVLGFCGVRCPALLMGSRLEVLTQSHWAIN